MIHCGESGLWGKSVRVCVLVGRCGENTHIRTNDTLWESALWGKSVPSSWSLWENTHICTNNTLWGKCIVRKNLCVVVAVVRKISFPHNTNFIFPQCNVLMCVTHYSERRILIAMRRPAYRYTTNHARVQATRMRILFISSVCNIALGYQPKSIDFWW